MEKGKTPLLDELEKGPWPSFVTEMKRAATKNVMAKDLLEQLESSYEDNTGHWKHGGIVGVKGYGGGVVGRYSDKPEEFPGVKECHTVRVNQVAGFFYTTKKLRELVSVWNKYGSELYNMHGSTGDIILLGTNNANLQPCVDALADIGFDLGGSGGAMRTLSCCVGQARCEKACLDSMDMIRDLTMHYQNEIHRPGWPYKFKIKVSACANDCAAASARSDLAIIGTWRDTIVIDNEEVNKKVDAGFNIERHVVGKCPGQALDWDSKTKTLKVISADCVRCLHCINLMPSAIHIGRERGATLLVGGKATVVKGSRMGSVIVPFIKAEAPYTEIKELIDTMTEWWSEHAKNRERIGELIDRLGLVTFITELGLKPIPQMVNAPRSNPFIYWTTEEVNK